MTPLVVGYIGRFDPNKCGSPSHRYGHILYEAMRGTDWWLLLAGPNAPPIPFEFEYHDRERCRVHPHEVANPGDWLRALDVFVLPSQTEGFPLTVMEAFLSGCRVASTRVSDLPDLFGDAIGFFDYGDVDGLRNAVRCAPPAEAGQYTIRTHLTVGKMIDQYEATLGS